MANTNANQDANEQKFQAYLMNAETQATELEKLASQYDEAANTAPTQYPRTDYVSQLVQQYKNSQPSAEEIKRENNKRKIAALGDGLIALSNMAGAIGGATPLQQNKTLTEAQKQRYEESLKYRPGYMSNQEYKSRLSTAMQQQRSEDSYYNRLRAQEDAQRKTASGNAIKARKESADVWKDLYAKAKALGIAEDKAKAIIEASREKTKQGAKKTSASIAQGWARVDKMEDKSNGETTEEYGDENHKTKVRTPNKKKKHGKAGGGRRSGGLR